MNELLESNGIDPVETRIVRHKDKALGDLLPQSAFHARYEFDAYQSCHSKIAESSLSNARYLASFVVLPDDRTIFVGLYEKHGTPQPISKEEFLSKPKLQRLIKQGYKFEDWQKGRVWFDLRQTEIMKEYVQCLSLEWDGKRTYMRKAEEYSFTVRVLNSPVFIRGQILN